MDEIRYLAATDLPRLAWCAFIDRDHRAVEVVHGDALERAHDFFCDGVWAGDLHARDLDAHFLAGSGGRIRDGHLVIAAPSHSLEKLVMAETSRGTIVSNSLPFALAAAGDGFDPEYPFTHNLLRTYKAGPDRAVDRIPTRNGAIRLLYAKNVHFLPGGEVRVEPKRPDPAFHDFAAYYDHLCATTRKLIDNGRAEGRQVRYEPTVTISGGYDSAAAAVVASRFGCTDALTFQRYDEGGNTRDHGGHVAAMLGMRLAEEDQYGYFARSDLPEALFAACGYNMGDVAAISWEAHLPERLLITGSHGGVVWASEDLAQRPLYMGADGASFSELRYRCGFAYLPLPFIGNVEAPSLHGITRSHEMDPWRVGGGYDRPIPRRIIEEAGIERGTFATKKQGSIVRVSSATANRYGFEFPLSPASAESFQRFLDRVDLGRYRRWDLLLSPAIWVFNRLTAIGNPHLRRGVGRVLHAFTALLTRRRPEAVLNARYGAQSVLPLWGIDVVGEEYAQALAGVAARSDA